MAHHRIGNYAPIGDGLPMLINGTQGCIALSNEDMEECGN